jgi:hypothetical protein
LRIVRVRVYQLTPDAFASFGKLISSFDEARPDVRVGGLEERTYERET